jgi:N-acetylmuramoyl-L-alanine amidase
VKAKYKSFSLKPTDGYGDRLVIDLYDAAETTAPKLVKTLPDVDAGPRDIVVAIDAGHGGEDPGARGYSGVYEKQVVLAIAKQLQSLVRQEPGMRPVMTRDGDYFISLRKRTLKARQEKADIFVSIHADSFRDRRASGTSLYVLSKHGATDEAARWLAEKENSSDLIGGVSLDDKDDLLASVLLDLSQTATIEASYAAGEAVLQRLRPLGMLHKTTVQQAGFVVLKSPDIPSLLVETAYLSNPTDERKLRSPSHQLKMAEAILDGIRDYFSKSPPAGTLFAARRHVITPGETLSDLSAHYRVSVARIKAANHLTGDVLKIGQVLRIPPDSEG